MIETLFLNEDMNGTCYVVRDDDFILIFDPGMAWNAPETIKKIRDCQGERQIAGIFITHSHYDHVVAIPYCRAMWPDVKVYAAEHCAAVMENPSARATMKMLAAEAAENNHVSMPEGYDENLMYVDQIIGGRDCFDFGKMHLEVVETNGHTRDSLSFVINEHTLIAAETLGLIYENGAYQSEFLVSFKDSLDSLRRCSQYDIHDFCMSHLGIIRNFTANHRWKDFEEGMIRAKDSTLKILIDFKDHDQRMKAMEKALWSPDIAASWPYDAFYLNAQAMLKTIDREFLNDVK